MSEPRASAQGSVWQQPGFMARTELSTLESPTAEYFLLTEIMQNMSDPSLLTGSLTESYA